MYNLRLKNVQNNWQRPISRVSCFLPTRWLGQKLPQVLLRLKIYIKLFSLAILLLFADTLALPEFATICTAGQSKKIWFQRSRIARGIRTRLIWISDSTGARWPRQNLPRGFVTVSVWPKKIQTNVKDKKTERQKDKKEKEKKRQQDKKTKRLKEKKKKRQNDKTIKRQKLNKNTKRKKGKNTKRQKDKKKKRKKTQKDKKTKKTKTKTKESV